MQGRGTSRENGWFPGLCTRPVITSRRSLVTSSLAIRSGRGSRSRSGCRSSISPKTAVISLRQLLTFTEGGCPRLTLLSTNASCQLEKPENSQVKAWGSTSTLGVELAPPRCLSSNWRERAARESLRNVADRGERGGGCCCQQNGRFELGQKSSGSPKTMVSNYLSTYFQGLGHGRH
jgi:hypothetical protein